MWKNCPKIDTHRPQPKGDSIFIPLNRRVTQMYPLQVVFEEGNLVDRLAEIREWLDQAEIEPGAFNYSMSASEVRLRIDFKKVADRDAFKETFAGWAPVTQ